MSKSTILAGLSRLVKAANSDLSFAVNSPGNSITTSVGTPAGNFSNLSLTAPGVSAAISIQASYVTLLGPSSTIIVRNISVSVSGAASGVANGLDTGTLTSNTWYSLWVISNGTTAAGLMSLSATSPTLPSGYVFKTRVGWMRTDSSGNRYPLAFHQKGREVEYRVEAGSNMASPLLIASGSTGITNPSTGVSLVNYIPPTAFKVNITILKIAGVAGTACVAPTATYGGADAPLGVSDTSTTTISRSNGRMLLQSTNVYWGSDNTSSRLYLYGWEDAI